MQNNKKENNKPNNFVDFISTETKSMRYICDRPDNVLQIRKEMSRYCSYDFSIQSGSTILITEAKVRNCSYKKYNEAILEIDKINRINELTDTMKPIAKALGFILVPFLICFYTDAVVGFEMNSSSREGSIWANAATADDGNNKKKTKPVKYFDINKGNVLWKQQ